MLTACHRGGRADHQRAGRPRGREEVPELRLERPDGERVIAVRLGPQVVLDEQMALHLAHRALDAAEGERMVFVDQPFRHRRGRERYAMALDEGTHVQKSLVTAPNTALYVDWRPYLGHDMGMPCDTTIHIERLKQLAALIVASYRPLLARRAVGTST